jgi:hypothetical protein
LFPEISRALYESPAPAEAAGAGAEVLRLAHKNLSWKQRWLGLDLDPAARIVLLLSLHREAITEELQGRSLRADFLWREFHFRLARLWPDDGAWQALASVSFGQEDIRRRLLEEIFIDAHCALYNGRARAPDAVAPDDRVFVHSRYVAQLADLAGIEGDQARALIEPAARLQIDALKRAKKWHEAIRACQQVLERFPGAREFQAELAGLLSLSVFSALRNKETATDCRADAAELKKAIGRVELARERFPVHPGFYEALAQCWHVRAVKLANGGELADALAAAAWARCYDPHSEELAGLESQLSGMMQGLQEQVKQLRAELATHSGATLNETGQRMLAQASLGFGPLTQVQASAKAAELPLKFARAQAYGIWAAVGLAQPSNDSDARPEALVAALAKVLGEPPADAVAIGTAWTAAAASDPELLVLDRRAIEEFLRRRLFPDTATEAPQPHPPEPPGAPVIEAAAPRAGGVEPAGRWLASRQDARVKLQTLGALALLAVAVGAYVGERGARADRDQAFAELRDAVAAGADEQVLNFAEAFLGARVRAHDPREAEVRGHYDRSFAHWFVSRPYALDTDAQDRIERYRALASR